MSVEPGFGGQKFIPEVLDKVKKIKKIITEKKLNIDIEIDGGINFKNSQLVKNAGANILVSGSTIFNENNGDLKKNIGLLRSNWEMLDLKGVYIYLLSVQKITTKYIDFLNGFF